MQRQQQMETGSMEYFVIGGTYTDTSFKVPDAQGECVLGPFESFEEARKVWHAKSMEHVDSAYARFRIEQHPKPLKQ